MHQQTALAKNSGLESTGLEEVPQLITELVKYLWQLYEKAWFFQLDHSSYVLLVKTLLA